MIKAGRDRGWGWGVQISCSDFQTVEGTFKKYSQEMVYLIYIMIVKSLSELI